MGESSGHDSLRWINGYDKELTVLERELYDLKAMPTLYLLDKDKKVLLKDARWNKWSNIWPTCSVGNYSDFSISILLQKVDGVVP